MALPQWYYLHGAPTVSGDLKTYNSDFKVFEHLGYEADGDGEHLFIEIEKDGLNSAYVAKLIARWANVTQREVGYAGKKDRYGVTRQHFSVQLPGKESPDLALLQSPQLTILGAKRNSKKLRTGALKGNRFEVLIRNMSLTDAVVQRLNSIKDQGVPNYFGTQRFGFDGENITRAMALFGGEKVKNRDLRGLYLSAARSLLFNNVVSERLTKKLGNTLFNGDVFMLQGTKASFAPAQLDDVIEQRFHDGDIALTAPLWGAGKNSVSDQALAFESTIIERESSIARGLESCGLKHARRSMLISVEDLTWQETNEGLLLTFALPAGSYATSVLREIAVITDKSLNR